MFTHHTVPMSVSNIIITKHNNDMRKLLLSLLCLFSAILVAQAVDQTVTLSTSDFTVGSSYEAKPLKNTCAFAKLGFSCDNYMFITAATNGEFQFNLSTSRNSFIQLSGNTNKYTIKSITVNSISCTSNATVYVEKKDSPFAKPSGTSGYKGGSGTELTPTLSQANNGKSVTIDVNAPYFALIAKTTGVFKFKSITITYDDGVSSLPAPSWSFAAPASLKLGEGFSVATGVQEGVNVTYSASRTDDSASESTDDLIKVVGGKIYPLVGGTLTVTASSAEVPNAFAPKSESVTVNAEKLPYPFGWVVNGAIQTGAVTCKNTQGTLQWASCADYFTAQGIDVPSAVVSALNAKLPARSVDASCSGDDVLTFNASDNSIAIKSGAKGKNRVDLSFLANDVAIGGDCSLDINVVDKDPTTWTFTSSKTELTLGEALEFVLTPVDGQPSPSIDANADVKVIDGKYYPTKVDEIILTATSAANDTYAAGAVSLTFTVSRYAGTTEVPLAADWKEDGTSVKGQTVQIHMTPDNVPTLSLPTLPAIFTTLGIPAPVLEVVSNGSSASWVTESIGEDGTTIPAHIEISTPVNGNTTFTAQAKEGAAANANYDITASAVTVKVGYDQPSWTAPTVPSTAKVAEALTFAPANVPDGVAVSVA